MEYKDLTERLNSLKKLHEGKLKLAEKQTEKQCMIINNMEEIFSRDLQRASEVELELMNSFHLFKEGVEAEKLTAITKLEEAHTETFDALKRKTTELVISNGERNSLIQSLGHHRQILSTLTTKLSATQSDLTAKTKIIQKLESNINALKIEKNQLNQNHTTAIRQLEQHLTQNHTTAIEQLTQKHTTTIQQLEQHLTQNHTTAIQQLTQNHTTAIQQLKQHLTRNHTTAIQLLDATHSNKITELEAKIQDQSVTIIEINKASELISQELQRVRTEGQIKISDLNGLIISLKSETTKKGKEIMAKDVELQRFESQNVKLEEKLQSLTDKLRDSIFTNEKDKAAWDEKVTEKNSKIQTLEMRESKLRGELEVARKMLSLAEERGKRMEEVHNERIVALSEIKNFMERQQALSNDQMDSLRRQLLEASSGEGRQMEATQQLLEKIQQTTTTTSLQLEKFQNSAAFKSTDDLVGKKANISRRPQPVIEISCKSPRIQKRVALESSSDDKAVGSSSSHFKNPRKELARKIMEISDESEDETVKIPKKSNQTKRGSKSVSIIETKIAESEDESDEEEEVRRVEKITKIENPRKRGELKVTETAIVNEEIPTQSRNKTTRKKVSQREAIIETLLEVENVANTNTSNNKGKKTRVKEVQTFLSESQTPPRSERNQGKIDDSLLYGETNSSKLDISFPSVLPSASPTSKKIGNKSSKLTKKPLRESVPVKPKELVKPTTQTISQPPRTSLVVGSGFSVDQIFQSFNESENETPKKTNTRTAARAAAKKQPEVIPATQGKQVPKVTAYTELPDDPSASDSEEEKLQVTKPTIQKKRLPKAKTQPKSSETLSDLQVIPSLKPVIQRNQTTKEALRPKLSENLPEFDQEKVESTVAKSSKKQPTKRIRKPKVVPEIILPLTVDPMLNPHVEDVTEKKRKNIKRKQQDHDNEDEFTQVEAKSRKLTKLVRNSGDLKRNGLGGLGMSFKLGTLGVTSGVLGMLDNE
ncbi:hypothetical protein HK096_002474 [Nowakowskiella sp. JEL0078]|nr:hypothetical protein HK096_002474 [Nowakowskiella sp. JEL0078]